MGPSFCMADPPRSWLHGKELEISSHGREFCHSSWGFVHADSKSTASLRRDQVME